MEAKHEMVTCEGLIAVIETEGLISQSDERFPP